MTAVWIIGAIIGWCVAATLTNWLWENSGYDDEESMGQMMCVWPVALMIYLVWLVFSIFIVAIILATRPFRKGTHNA